MSKKTNAEPKLLAPPANDEHVVVSYDTTGNENDLIVEAEASTTQGDAELVAQEIDDGTPHEPGLSESFNKWWTDSTLAVRLQFGFFFACLMGKVQDWTTKASLWLYGKATTAYVWLADKATELGKAIRHRWDYITPMSKGYFRDLAMMSRDNPDDSIVKRLAAVEGMVKSLVKRSNQVDPDLLAKYTLAVMQGRNMVAIELHRHMTGSTLAGAKLAVEAFNKAAAAGRSPG